MIWGVKVLAVGFCSLSLKPHGPACPTDLEISLNKIMGFRRKQEADAQKQVIKVAEVTDDLKPAVLMSLLLALTLCCIEAAWRLCF